MRFKAAAGLIFLTFAGTSNFHQQHPILYAYEPDSTGNSITRNKWLWSG